MCVNYNLITIMLTFCLTFLTITFLYQFHDCSGFVWKTAGKTVKVYIPLYHSFHLHPLGPDFSLNSKDKDLLIVQF